MRILLGIYEDYLIYLQFPPSNNSHLLGLSATKEKELSLVYLILNFLLETCIIHLQNYPKKLDTAKNSKKIVYEDHEDIMDHEDHN